MSDANESTPVADAAPTPAGDAPKKTRKPLDESARAAIAQRAVVKRLTKKVGGAKSEAEFWALTEELAKKQGKAVAAAPKNEPAAAAEIDPLDRPVMKGWPTSRQMQEAMPTAAGLLEQIATVAKGTRYEEPATKAQESCAPALAATIAKYMASVEVGPGAALAIAAAMAFGPALASHAYEVAGPKVSAWWAARQDAKQTATSLVPVKKKAEAA